MALSKREMEILDEMSFEKGGGYMRFAQNQYCVTAADEGFLFLGLGGKGGKVLKELKAGIYKNFQFEDGKTHPDNMEFLAIDTDEADLNQLCRSSNGEIGLEMVSGNEEICQLYDADAAVLLKFKNQGLIPKNISSWLTKDMGAALQGTGAGGIRQAARYLLFSNGFSRVRKGIEHKLSNLHKTIVETENPVLNIFIFAGIGGGTGSGTIIDIPYIVREICARNSWECKISGFLMMPDTYGRGVRDNAAIWRNVRRNTYAALKEINYYMTLEFLKGTAKFQYEYRENFKIEHSSMENIFNTCYLVTGKKERGGEMTEPDKEIQRVVADTVMNLVKKSTNVEFLITSFMDNSWGVIRAVMGMYNQVPKDSNFAFNTIGYSKITLPLEQMFTYTANQFYQDLKDAWSVQATQQEVEQTLGQFRLLPEKIYEDILRKSTKNMLGIGDVDTPSKEDISSGVYYSNIKSQWRNFNVGFINAIEAASNLVASDLAGQLDHYLKKVLLEKGFFYAVELLSGRIEGDYVINGMLTRLQNEFIDSVHDFQATQNNMRDQYKRERMQLEKNPPMLWKGGWIKAYQEICVNEMNCDTNNLVWGQAEKVLNQIIAHLKKKTEEWGRYQEILQYLGTIMEKNYSMAKEQTIGDAHAVQLLDISKNDQQTQNFLDWLAEQVCAVSQDVKEARAGRLVTAMLETRKYWMESEKEEGFQPVRVLVEFIENEFDFLKNMTLQEFVNIYFDGNIDNRIESIFNDLMSKGELLAAPSNGFPWFDWVRHSYITVPNGAGNITAAIKKQAADNGIQEVVCQNMNTISYINVSCGLPAYAFADIADYEQVYEEVVGNSKGLHISETKDENLKELPPLLPSGAWNFLSKFNERESEFLNEKYEGEGYENIVKKYLKMGIIWWETAEGYSAYYIPEESRITKEQIVGWCRTQYLQDNEKPDMESFKQKFDKEFKDEYKNLISIPVSIDTFNLQEPNSEKGLQEFMRYHVALMKNLKPICEAFKECEKMIEKAKMEK